MDRRLLAAWLIGVACGLAVVVLGGSEYRQVPEHHDQPQFIRAQNRGWEIQLFPEGCQRLERIHCTNAIYKRPRALFFMGGP